VNGNQQRVVCERDKTAEERLGTGLGHNELRNTTKNETKRERNAAGCFDYEQGREKTKKEAKETGKRRKRNESKESECLLENV